jgi:hypothetical protein
MDLWAATMCPQLGAAWEYHVLHLDDKPPLAAGVLVYVLMLADVCCSEACKCRFGSSHAVLLMLPQSLRGHTSGLSTRSLPSRLLHAYPTARRGETFFQEHHASACPRSAYAFQDEGWRKRTQQLVV